MKRINFKKSTISISIFGIILLGTILVYLQACNKKNDGTSLKDNTSNSQTISLDGHVKQITKLNIDVSAIKNHLKSKVNGNTINGTLLDNLLNSTTWASIPQNLQSDITFADGVTITDYTNSKVQAICFTLKSNMNYKSLVFYTYNGEFTPVIISSENREDKTFISVSDLSSKPYFDFYVNKEHKMGLFKMHMNIPRFTKNLSTKNLSLRLKSSAGESTGTKTCMETTKTFGDCMLCAIAECGHDWVCAVVCFIATRECMAGFGIACLVG